TLAIRASLEKVTDARPPLDIKATKSIPDLSDKVTAKLLSDFRESQVFQATSFPVDPESDVVLKVTIKRFYWKFKIYPTYFLPLIQVIHIFGAPMADILGISELTAKVVHQTSGNEIATYEGKGQLKSVMSMYDMKTGEMGAELADAFRQASKQIKEAIWKDKQRIEETVQRIAAPAQPQSPAIP
ncbi:MAG: hypothetical protein AB1405_08095, partial [Bdellovibrionota bacterium]